MEDDDQIKAAGFLNKAIEIYQKGFEADWRDTYPGINLLHIFVIKGEEAKINELAPVVTYSVNRKLQTKIPCYWDYATLLEIALIANDGRKADEYMQKALTTTIEGSWMLKTTMDSLERFLKQKRIPMMM